MADISETKGDETKVSMENFELLRVLGQGAYGKVFLVRKVGGADHSRIYAMKILKKDRLVSKPKTLEHTLAERSVLEHIRQSPFLVSMYYAFQTESKLHIIMDYVSGGELFTHLCSRGSLGFQETQFYVSELCIALDHLHQLGIIYRDLKLENVMLDQEGHICLTDFGLSKEFKPSDPLQRTSSYCGTIEYMAPEVIKRPEGGYSEIVDWWSLGVFTFELLTGCSPFTVEGSKNTSREIAERILSKPVPFPRNFHSTAKDFVTKLLNKEPSQRLGASRGLVEIQSHAFFEGIDWSLLTKRAVKPPHKPKLNSSIDVQYFATEFTSQEPIVSPDQAPNTALHKQLFRGYSFVSPSILLSADNIIGADCVADSIGLNIQLLGEQEHSPFFQKYTLDLTREGFLGRGAFSVCRRCTHKDTGADFAVKIVSQRFGAQTSREAQILAACQDHRNVVKLLDAFQDRLHIYLVMELLRGDELLTKIKKSRQFTESEASRITRRLLSAVKFLHDKGVVHRDLKPENILFESNDEKSDLRIIDFGFARFLPPGQGRDRTLTTPCYTLHYAAPEVLDRPGVGPGLLGAGPDFLPQYNEQCDLWSLGVVVYIMLCGHAPFHARAKSDSAGDIMRRIRTAEFSFDGPEWSGVSDDAKDFISGLLTVDPEERLTADEAAEHLWLQTGRTSDTTLATPNILNSGPNTSFNETFRAFITANREGFHLADVSNAPLAQRRRRKQRVSSDDSGYLSGSGGVNAQAHVASAASRTSLGGDGAFAIEPPFSLGGCGRKRKLVTVVEERGAASTTPSSTTAAVTLTIPAVPSDALTYAATSTPTAIFKLGSATSLDPTLSQDITGQFLYGASTAELQRQTDSFRFYRESPESARSTVDVASASGADQPPSAPSTDDSAE